MGGIILYCFPYAGGTASYYYDWSHVLGDGIRVIPIEYKGRGRRANEEFCSSLEELVADIGKQITEINGTENYALFGHSMGSTIAYEVYHWMQLNKLPTPNYIFFSGAEPPMTKEYSSMDLSNTVLLQKLKSYGGTENLILDNQEMLTMVLERLRNDLLILYAYELKHNQIRMDCNIHILWGKDDNINYNRMLEWEKLTSMECSFTILEGGHFYNTSGLQSLFKVLKQQLQLRE